MLLYSTMQIYFLEQWTIFKRRTFIIKINADLTLLLFQTLSSGGARPPAPKPGLPCDCPPGKGLSEDKFNQTECLPCNVGSYGSGGEIINNWKDWTNNGTVPPEGSGIVTFCEADRVYVQPCQSWKASGNDYWFCYHHHVIINPKSWSWVHSREFINYYLIRCYFHNL